VGSSNPLSQMEWEKLQASLPRGSEVRGNVVSVRPFGVFVDIGLDPGIPVLLEIIHFKIRQDEPKHRIEFPQDTRSFARKRSTCACPASMIESKTRSAHVEASSGTCP
jgi:hypothetical protein